MRNDYWKPDQHCGQVPALSTPMRGKQISGIAYTTLKVRTLKQTTSIRQVLQYSTYRLADSRNLSPVA